MFTIDIIVYSHIFFIKNKLGVKRYPPEIFYLIIYKHETNKTPWKQKTDIYKKTLR